MLIFYWQQYPYMYYYIEIWKKIHFNCLLSILSIQWCNIIIIQIHRKIHGICFKRYFLFDSTKTRNLYEWSSLLIIIIELMYWTSKLGTTQIWTYEMSNIDSDVGSFQVINDTQYIDSTEACLFTSNFRFQYICKEYKSNIWFCVLYSAEGETLQM